MAFNPMPGQGIDVNRLRAALAAGQITEDDLAGMTLSGRLGGAPQPPANALARAAMPPPQEMPQEFVRNEETGSTTYFQPRNAMPSPAPRVRVVGVGNGSRVDLGEEQAPLPPLDYSRPGIEIPGMGKGVYSRDGRFAIFDDGQGGKTKVILGYDQEGSDRANARRLAFEKARADLAHTDEQTGLLRDKRMMLAAANAPVTDAGPQILTQKQLEEVHGKPDKGFRWSQDGRLEPLPGGEVQRDAQGTVDKASDAIGQIDSLVGKRDASGKLVEGAKAHPGFGQSVGLGIPGLKYIPGSDPADFNRRLDQLKGGAFLQAFESLKGGGQITEVEGRKATDAITRMSTSQSEDEFVKAATEFRSIVERGMQRAGQRGGAPARSVPGASAGPRRYNPETGRIE